MVKRRVKQDGPEGEASGPSESRQFTAEEIHQIMANEIAAGLGGLVSTFLEDLLEDPGIQEAIWAHVERLLEEQQAVQTAILPSMTDPQEIEDKPLVGLVIWPVDREDLAVPLHIEKDVRAIGDNPRKAFDFCGLLAFMLFPASRGLMRLLGFDYRFVNVKVKKEPNLTIVE